MNKNLALPEHMRHLAAGIVLAAALSGCARTAHMDTTVGSVVTPGNTQVPLPPGNWKKLAEQGEVGGPETGGGTNNLHHVEAWYGLTENNSIKSLIYVYTSSDAAAPSVYVPNSFCMQTSSSNDIYLHEIDGIGLNYSDCVKVHRIRFTPPVESSTPIYKDFYPILDHNGGVPRNCIQAVFADSLGFRYLNYHIYFFPSAMGLKAIAGMPMMKGQPKRPTCMISSVGQRNFVQPSVMVRKICYSNQPASHLTNPEKHSLPKSPNLFPSQAPKCR